MWHTRYPLMHDTMYMWITHATHHIYSMQDARSEAVFNLSMWGQKFESKFGPPGPNLSSNFLARTIIVFQIFKS